MQGAGCRVQGAGCRVQGVVETNTVRKVIGALPGRLMSAQCFLQQPGLAAPGQFSLLCTRNVICDAFMYRALHARVRAELSAATWFRSPKLIG